jgi:hypothetical protein
MVCSVWLFKPLEVERVRPARAPPLRGPRQRCARAIAPDPQLIAEASLEMGLPVIARCSASSSRARARTGSLANSDSDPERLTTDTRGERPSLAWPPHRPSSRTAHRRVKVTRRTTLG